MLCKKIEVLTEADKTETKPFYKTFQTCPLRLRVFASCWRPKSRSNFPVGNPVGEKYYAGRAARIPAQLVVRVLGFVLRCAWTSWYMRALVWSEGVPRLRIRVVRLWSEWNCAREFPVASSVNWILTFSLLYFRTLDRLRVRLVNYQQMRVYQEVLWHQDSFR